MPDCLVLFDIDGTLLLSGGAGFRSMGRAAEEVFGRALAWDRVEFAGGLDTILLDQAAALVGLELSPKDHERFRARYTELLPGELERSADRMQVMPGVHDVIAELQDRPHVTIGILTGNYEPTARAKLEAAGFDWSVFELGAYGDDAPTRPGLMPVARERFERLRSRPIAPERVVLVGDTPRDVHCARSNGCHAFAVATGKHSLDDLRAAGADVAVSDLRDPRPLYALLAAAGNGVTGNGLREEDR